MSVQLTRNGRKWYPRMGPCPQQTYPRPVQACHQLLPLRGAAAMAHLLVHLANRLRSPFHHDAERRPTLFGCPRSGACKVSARLVKHGLSAEDGHEGD